MDIRIAIHLAVRHTITTITGYICHIDIAIIGRCQNHRSHMQSLDRIVSHTTLSHRAKEDNAKNCHNIIYDIPVIVRHRSDVPRDKQRYHQSERRQMRYGLDG